MIIFMAKALKVTRVRKHLFGKKITVKALRDTSVVFDSFLGEREFYLDEGDRLTLIVRGYDWREKDKLSLSTLVSVAWEWADIPWQWN